MFNIELEHVYYHGKKLNRQPTDLALRNASYSPLLGVDVARTLVNFLGLLVVQRVASSRPGLSGRSRELPRDLFTAEIKFS